MTVHSDPILVERGLATGALGYVLKLTAGDELVPAVRAALRGERHVSQLPAAPEANDRERLERFYVCPQHVVVTSLPETELEQITQLAVDALGTVDPRALR